ncbi:MAG TPA: CHAT domain-containing protein, partial [Thermomonospora sp.]|nr:CHAT domain-containing protein [Thermomonospora sp.]
LAVLEQAVRTRARRRSPPAGNGAPPAACDVAELVDALGDRALVQLIRVGGELHAVTVVAGRCRRWPLGPYERAVREAGLLRFAVRRLARSGDEAGVNGLRHAAQDVATRIPAGLIRALADREVVLAPTGPLHAVPWAAVVRRPFTVVPSATAWLYAHRTGPAGAGGVVLAAGPDLAEAGAEVAALSRLYPGATTLVGADATAEAVRRACEGADLVHLAAHGEFRSDNALFSHLRLADGPLMGYDLEDLTVAPRLMVLSACEAGRASAGDGALGIVGVLLSLGTATVVASVAPVRDVSARTFMTGFHRRLREGMTPSQALAAVPRTSGDLGFLCFGAG